MKQKSIIALALAFLSGVAHADKAYDGYDAFFDDQPGQLFQTPTSNDYLPVTYGPSGEATASWAGSIGEMPLKLTVTSRGIRIDNRKYSFADAVRLPGDKQVDVDPRAVTLYIASSAGATGPDICIEAAGSGSGTADRYSQVYVIEAQTKHRFRLFKLPSLFGSCRSIVRQQGVLQFPQFSYRRVSAVDSPVGTDVQYFVIHGKNYVRAERHFSTRFTDPADVFQFEVE